MFRQLTLISPLIAFGLGSNSPAETRTLTFQRGFHAYNAVHDTLLYAPDSVANVNYGSYPSLGTGLNRWGETLVALIRFDLSAVPPEASVIDATLCLYDTSTEWPNEDLLVEAQLVSAENDGWKEGNNDGTRVPLKGTSCWNWLSYDTRPWAGAPGLSQEGTDYSVPPVGTARVPRNHEGWVEFELRPDVVGEWLGQETNPGLRIFPRGAGKSGQYVSFRSSETNDDPSTRPRLVLEAEMDDAVYHRYLRRKAIRALDAIRVGFAAQVEKEIGFRDTAGGRVNEVVAAVEDRIQELDGTLRPRRSLSEKRLLLVLEDMDRLHRDLADFAGDLTIARAASYNEQRSRNTDFALGVADSMANVLREPGRSDVSLSDTVEISMARNEFESCQVVLIPVDRDLKDSKWSVTDLGSDEGARIPAADISIQVMGYMKSVKPAIISDSEWWPVPILDFMDSVDVPCGEVQPLWVTVRTRQETPPGLYKGTIDVRANGLQPKRMRLMVNVWDFAVPREQHLLTVWGNVELAYQTIYGERYDRRMARAMFDFLINHRLAVTTLYAQQAAGEPQAGAFVGYPTLSDPAELRRLWDAGSRWWNLGYIHPTFAERAGKTTDEYVPDFLAMLRESLRVADAAGWPRGNMAIYLFDETKDFESLDRVAARVKKAFPDIPLMTTAYDRSYGVKGGPLDASIDIWCPLTPRYVEDLKVIEAGRKAGKKAWWYVCCGPRGNSDLNFFSQFPAIRSRLLMGAAAWKYRPDGFLYYRISGWKHYEKPIDTGPFVDWKPYFLPGPDGDGELICPGPNGPLSTLQFENLRDGIEDYEYYWVLDDLVRRAREQGVSVEPEAGLLEVPGDLLESITGYSEAPARLRDARRRIAEAIVAVQGRLKESL